MSEPKKAPDDAKIPANLYSCCMDDCSEQRTFPAEELYWTEWGWMCEWCMSDTNVEEDGESLADFIKRRGGV